MSAARVPGLATVRITAPVTSRPSGSMRALTRSVSSSGQRGADSSAVHTADGDAAVEKMRLTVMRPSMALCRVPPVAAQAADVWMTGSAGDLACASEARDC